MLKPKGPDHLVNPNAFRSSKMVVAIATVIEMFELPL